MKAFEAAEVFWKNVPVHWETGADGVTLLVTTRGKEGEQILLPFQDVCNLPMQLARKRLHESGMDPPQIETFLVKGDEVIRSFLKGEAERGFLSFAEYLDFWLEAKDAVIDRNPEVEEILSGLLGECVLAIQNKDLVTLMDAIEYGFKPLIQQYPFKNGA